MAKDRVCCAAINEERGKRFFGLFIEGNQTIGLVNRDPPIQNEQKYANTSDLLTSVYMAPVKGERIWILKVESTPSGDVWRARSFSSLV